MNRYLLRILILTTLCIFVTAASAKELIREFKGTESTTTAEFEVKAPWIVDWRLTGDYPGQMALHVNLVTAQTGEHLGKIVTTKYVSDGVRLFEEGGTYRFQVNSSLINQWTLRVEELTSQEAEAYTPRER